MQTRIENIDIHETLQNRVRPLSVLDRPSRAYFCLRSIGDLVILKHAEPSEGEIRIGGRLPLAANVMHRKDCMSRNRRRRGRNSLLGASLGALIALTSIAHSQAQLNQAASDEDISTTSKFRGRSAVEDARQGADGGAGKRYATKSSLGCTGSP